MKKMYVISLVLISILVTAALSLKFGINKKEIDISFLTAKKITHKNLLFEGGLNYYEWFIVTNENQRSNLEIEGYIIPSVDFNQNYLILSRYKILSLYIKKFCFQCSRVPEGKVIFDKLKSKDDTYYIYRMPRIMLIQGIG